ncbi:MFS transporter [Thermoflavimicrobium dichotomicum]|uniref:Major Facilitator Superfamily protein n=1 Tax=Thermoflavimicrobium dichotomicum TaxID=46223 RepID=A0A1I3TGN0_9BACL|nr:MFS transporter [Thermoflavimicrobium dichotomicum]SFJ69673.1 Major Facilitator Superfamily protein [Thermoflavimicrobium dichotomicum]
MKRYGRIQSIPDSIGVLLFSSFLMNVGGFAVYTFLSIYLSQTLHFSALQVGSILTANLLAQRGLPLVMGLVGDRTSHSQMIIFGYLIRGLGFLGIAFFQQYWIILLCALLAGLGGALFGPSVSAVFASVSIDLYKQVFATYNQALNLGVITGPIVAGLLISIDPVFPFLWAGLIFLLMALLIFFFRKEYQTPRSSESVIFTLKEVFSHRSFIFFLLVLCFYWMIFQLLFLFLFIPIQSVVMLNR